MFNTDRGSRQRFINALVSDLGLRFVETKRDRYTGEIENKTKPDLKTVVMPELPSSITKQQETQYFSRLLDECYFRMPELRNDLAKLNANVGKEDGSTDNLEVIYTDVLRQQAHTNRNGILLGADEYAQQAHEIRVTTPVEDPRAQAWNAFDAESRMKVGLCRSDYGLVNNLSDEAKPLYDKLKKELGEAYTKPERTPDENFNIASKACELLFEEEHQDQQPQQGDGEGEGQEGDDQQEGQGKESPSKGEDEPKEGKTPSGDPKERGSSKEAEWSRNETDLGFKPHEIGENQTYEIPDTREAIYPLPTKVISISGDNSNSYRVNVVNEQLNFQLGHKIRNMLKVLAQARYRGGHKTGRINKKSIASVSSGNDRVFRKKEQKDVLNTAIMLLVDSSGSMSGTKYTVATAASAALSEVLTKVRIPHSIMGFTTRGRTNIMYDHVKFNTWPTTETVINKMSDNDVDLAGNSDAEALLHAYDILREQKQKRKIMIVLSDGQPADGTNPHAYLQQVTEEIESNGKVELYAIGIQTNSVKEYYSNYRIINRANQLESELLGLLKQTVIDGN